MLFLTYHFHVCSSALSEILGPISRDEADRTHLHPLMMYFNFGHLASLLPDFLVVPPQTINDDVRGLRDSFVTILNDSCSMYFPRG
jgi:hypothetical protein